MLEIPFTKMHGLGNNYIYVNLFTVELPESLLTDLAQRVSNVFTGIGSDGMILIHPSERADVGMRIFNKDGSEGKSCGNGLRCVAKYVYEHGTVTKETFQIETKANIVTATIHAEGETVREVTVDMGKPQLQRAHIPMIGKADDYIVGEPFEIGDTQIAMTAVSMGNPHAVIFVDNIEKAPLYELGPIIEKDTRFPEGVNAEFIEVISENELNFRVWERGSGVTQACGTGACAAVVAAALNGYVNRNEEVTVHLQGGDLMITWDENGIVWMRGGAETIASGTYIYNS